MLRNIVAFTVVALTGALATEPVDAAGGMRMGGGFRAAPMMQRGPRAILRPPPHAFAPRGAHGGQAFNPHGAGKFGHRAVIPPSAQGAGRFGHRAVIPPSPHGYATTTPQRPFGGLARRHHGIYHSGWYFPATIGGDLGYGYIGIPYDPSEAIPVYGPAPNGPAPVYGEPADAPARSAPATARVTNPDNENRDACRAERVTVPSGNGEREIKVVRC
jgi:hypothetical protein